MGSDVKQATWMRLNPQATVFVPKTPSRAESFQAETYAKQDTRTDRHDRQDRYDRQDRREKLDRYDRQERHSPKILRSPSPKTSSSTAKTFGPALNPEAAEFVPVPIKTKKGTGQNKIPVKISTCESALPDNQIDKSTSSSVEQSSMAPKVWNVNDGASHSSNSTTTQPSKPESSESASASESQGLLGRV